MSLDSLTEAGMAERLRMVEDITEQCEDPFPHFRNAVASTEWVDETEQIEPRVYLQFNVSWSEADDEAEVERLHLIEYVLDVFPLAYVGEELTTTRSGGKYHEMEFILTDEVSH
jgi:hypothetical protein